MNIILITIGVLSIIVYLLSTIMIYIFLEKRDEKIENFIFIRLFLFRYVNNYKRITKNETGKVGYLFYSWLISINAALLCFVLLIIFGKLFS